MRMRGKAEFGRHSPRAAAEIELILVLPLMLVLLFVIGSMLILGPAHVLNVFKANQEAFRDATVVDPPQLAGSTNADLVDDPLATLKPELPPLPNRVHEMESTKNLSLRVGVTDFWTPSLTDSAFYTSPAVAYSSWPVQEDSQPLEAWMKAYAEESKDPDTVERPLGLAPAWPP